jgi:hypothetical protein
MRAEGLRTRLAPDFRAVSSGRQRKYAAFDTPLNLATAHIGAVVPATTRNSPSPRSITLHQAARVLQIGFNDGAIFKLPFELLCAPLSD